MWGESSYDSLQSFSFSYLAQMGNSPLEPCSHGFISFRCGAAGIGRAGGGKRDSHLMSDQTRVTFVFSHARPSGNIWKSLHSVKQGV